MSEKAKLTEKEIFDLYKKTNSKKVRDKIFEKYVYIAEISARKFIGLGIDYDDIYQVACIGLLNAIERFDSTFDNKFSTYATPTIVGEIKRYFRDKGNFIKLPRKLYDIFYKATKIKSANLDILGKSSDIKEIASELNVSTEELKKAIEANNINYVKSLDQLLFNKEETSLAFILGKEDDSFLVIENKDFVKKCMEKLTSEEQSLVTMRYFEQLTQKEISEKLNVSQMYISRLERKLLGKLKTMYFKY